MTANSPALRQRHYHAPAEDGESLQFPPLAAAREIRSQNVACFAALPIQIGDRTLGDLRREAQAELLQLARAHVRRYSDQSLSTDSAVGIIMSGHQPELFHPGVWYKNFALSALAEHLDCVGVNLVIDSELCRAVSIKVPTGSLAEPRIKDVAFDQSASGLPYETTRIQDQRCFASFAGRATERIKQIGIERPILERLWPLAAELAADLPLLGGRVAAARHRLEQSWGLRTLELPLSSVCRTNSFAVFAGQILADLPRFVEIYNRGLSEFRRVNRLRSKTHPAPDLFSDGSRFETPFWYWNETHPQRQPLYVNWTAQSVKVDNDVHHGEVPRSQAEELVHLLNRNGTAFRSRALITTMYARMVLCDVFIHGIGGAKYDELTDWIIREFFGFEPPSYFALSATLQLPLPIPRVRQMDIRRIDTTLRALQFHPENFLAKQLDGGVAQLVSEKRDWIRQSPPRGKGLKRFQNISRINRELQAVVEPVAQNLRSQRESLLGELKRKQILASREYSFCLFPEQPLRTRLADLAQVGQS